MGLYISGRWSALQAEGSGFDTHHFHHRRRLTASSVWPTQNQRSVFHLHPVFITMEDGICAGIAQLVEHELGKFGVPSSNLGISSINHYLSWRMARLKG